MSPANCRLVVILQSMLIPFHDTLPNNPSEKMLKRMDEKKHPYVNQPFVAIYSLGLRLKPVQFNHVLLVCAGRKS